MLKWPRMDRIHKVANTFFTQNLSQDDPFLLYAAIKSGLGTTFCSRDLMRGHAYLLGDDLKPIFQKWRTSHQYMLITAKNEANTIIRTPRMYKTSAHKVDNVWHIPFVEEEMIQLEAGLQEEIQWLCVKI